MRLLLQAIRAAHFRISRIGVIGFLKVLWGQFRSHSLSDFLKILRFQAAKFGSESVSYKLWLEQNTLTDSMFEEMRSRSSDFTHKIVFSIVMPVFNVPERWLQHAIDSVKAQVYPHWELCIADDASSEPHIKPMLAAYVASDPRIKVIYRSENGHISLSTNTALELATGDYICLMDHDDEIAPNALYEFAAAIQQLGRIGMVYSDEDKISVKGERYEPFFKPDWSPEYLESCFYTAHFACYRSDLVHKVGGFRAGYDGAQDFDFVLRFVEHAPQIAHVAKVLYHWRAIEGSTAKSMHEKGYVVDAACRALRDHLSRRQIAGSVIPGAYPGCFELRHGIRGRPLVSIVIPSAGRNARVRGNSTDLLANCVDSIRKKTKYRNYEIVVVDNGDLREETLFALAGAGCRFVHFRESFNIATKMNLGAAKANGEFLVFLNDDIEIIEPAWLEDMLQLAQRNAVGVVGAKLLFEDGTLQHAGVTFDEDGLPDHILRSYPGSFPGYYFSCVGTRNYMAVTGACLMTRAEVFRKIGGFDEDYPINYNDIDYCLRAYSAGLRIVFCPLARLYHFESKNRDRVVEQEAIERFRQRWSSITMQDPYYGRMFDKKPPNFRLGAP